MQWIEKCLQSVRNSSMPVSTLVIDNMSFDGTVDFIKNNYPEIILINNKNNMGFGKANNIGLEYAVRQNYDYAFLLNQDAWPEQDTIEKLIKVHLADSAYGIISPLQLDGQGDTIDRNFVNCIPYKSLFEVKNAITRNNLLIDTNFVNAASWLISKFCLLKIGIFDPLFMHYGEDRDYCNRVIYHNLKIGIVLDSIIYHDRVYDKNNPFRKYKHIVLSIGMVHLKNINHSLFYNCLTWLIKRTKETLKWIILFRVRLFLDELSVNYTLFLMISKIIRSRANCRLTNIHFYHGTSFRQI